MLNNLLPPSTTGESSPASDGASKLGRQPSSPVETVKPKLDRPEATEPFTIYWLYAIPLAAIHLLSLLALIPYFFSWSGLALCIAGHFVFGMLGITIGYHRLLTHQGFSCPKWFEYTLAILGICNLQDSPSRWVAIHRIHHKHSDERPDPHSPLVNFLWGHVGWLLVVNREHKNVHCFEPYVRDLLRQRFYLNLERKNLWLGIFWLHALAFVIAGALTGWITTGTSDAAVQLGLSWFVWGVLVRTVFVLNGTWAVNSIGHIFGYQNYKTGDNSRNNWFVALIAHGEGWHNNHHADQRSARHGHKWWELDMSWWVIWMLEKIGLVWNVSRPKKTLQQAS